MKILKHYADGDGVAVVGLNDQGLFRAKYNVEHDQWGKWVPIEPPPLDGEPKKKRGPKKKAKTSKWESKPLPITKEEALAMYWDREMTTKEIAEKIGRTESHVLAWWRLWGLTMRSRSEGLKLAAKKRAKRKEQVQSLRRLVDSHGSDHAPSMGAAN